MIGATGGILYASAVLIPQFAQTVLVYNATWAGLILSPGGIAVILLIPFVGRLMAKVQMRFLIAIGFTVMGCALVYSSTLVPNIDFKTLVLMRTFQTAGLAFLFVPISTIAYMTLPRGTQWRRRGAVRDVPQCFRLDRHCARRPRRSRSARRCIRVICRNGSRRSISPTRHSSRNMSRRCGRWAASAPRRMIKPWAGSIRCSGRRPPSSAYCDVFFYCAIVAFLIVPLCFLLSPKTGGMRAGGGH